MLFAIAILSIFLLIINLSVMSAACTVLVFLLLWMARKERNPINPYILFLTTPISLLLYTDTLNQQYLPGIQMTTQLLIVGGIYSYLLGLLMLRKRSLSPTPGQLFIPSFWSILAIGLLPHVLGILVAGIPILANDVNAARQSYVIPIIGQFTIFLPLSMLIAFRNKNRFMVLISAVLSIFLSFGVASKFTITLTFLFLIFAYYRYDGRKMFRIRPIYLSLIAVVSVPFLFESIFSVREDVKQLNTKWREEIVFNSSLLETYGDYTYLPFLYLTTPWSNFSYIIEEDLEATYGARTIHPIASIFQLDGLLDIEQRPVRMSAFNTHAYLSDFYLDFGPFGVFLLSFLLGLLVKWSYLRMLRTPDVLNEGAWIAIGFASLMLFFSNHFTGLTYPILALILFNSYRRLGKSVIKYNFIKSPTIKERR